LRLSISFLIPMLLFINAICGQNIIELSTEILQLQGPRNTSVEKSATAQLKCRLLTAKPPKDKSKYHYPSPSSSSSSLHFIPWRMSGNQRVSVQWIIDGFGFTNDSLMESYEGRYVMPGPLSEGVFDLFVYKVRNLDQTSFSCQVTIQTFQLMQPPRVKTLTSSTIFITIYSAPDRLLLRQIPLTSASKSLQDSSTKLSPDRIQSDNPSQSDAHAFPNFDEQASSTLSRPPISHTISHSSNSMDANFRNGDNEVWALEGSEVSLECVASPSSPVSRLMWILSPVAELEAELSMPPTFDFGSFSEKSRTPQYDREYPTWRYVFNSKAHNGLGYKIVNKEIPDVGSGLNIGCSILTLRMDRSLSGRRLECLIQNAAAFEKPVMPKVTTTLQVFYIKNMNITKNISNNKMIGEAYRENETVRFHCTVDSNPKELRYV
uniref:Ig-like domain-containing protein n=1 Tax=Rodentolepis nana TaxID=102285 RepID=A0A0R3TP02_RODNA